MNLIAVRHGRGGREFSGFMRTIAALVAAVFTFVLVEPAAAAVYGQIQRMGTPASLSVSDEIQRDMLAWRDDLRRALKPSEPGIAAAIADAGDFLDRLDRLDRRMRAEFRQIERHIRQHELPPLIMERHARAEAEYRKGVDRAREALVAWSDPAPDPQAAASELQALLDELVAGPSHQPLDPDNLPWGSPEARVRPPMTRQEDLQQLLQADETLQGEDAVAPAAAGNGDFQLQQAASPDIVALVEALDDDPVRIYHWVRNHIEFIPSYGVIQGADETLANRRGNAFDTATLLVGMLSAAGVEARYVYGTVDIPVEQVMNWVGGVTSPEAAGDLLGQGGVPVVSLVSGGRVSHFRIEHVWVEALIDYEPSYGAVHREGDAWIPLDASFKQYEYAEGLDFGSSDLPFDVEGHFESLLSDVEFDEVEGWIRGIRRDAVEKGFVDFLDAVEEFVDAQVEGEPTVGDVVGNKFIISLDDSTLPTGLPYRVISESNPVESLPASLHWQFRYELLDQHGFSLLSWQQRTASLAGRSLALSFRPSAQSDLDTLASFLPDTFDTDEFDPSSLPDSIPGYLVNVTPELTLDGAVIAAAGRISMGTELHVRMGYRSPAHGWMTRVHIGHAGEYHAVGLDLQGISNSRLARLEDQIAEARTRIEQDDHAGLTRHDVTGVWLQSGISGYFAMNNAQDDLAQRIAGIVQYRLPSFGIFKTTVSPVHWFGIPRDVSFDGFVMDIQHLMSQTVDRNGDNEARVAFNRTVGPRISALEHIVPEEIFGVHDNPDGGISAVKVLALATMEGQRLFSITQANLDLVMPQLQIDDATKSDIRNAVNRGMEVTVSESSISHGGWQGVGYVVIDPTTGAGGYMISGGINGGSIKSGWSKIATWVKWFNFVDRLVTGLSIIYEWIKSILACGWIIGTLFGYMYALMAGMAAVWAWAHVTALKMLTAVAWIVLSAKFIFFIIIAFGLGLLMNEVRKSC
jgi:hypothetical protein